MSEIGGKIIKFELTPERRRELELEAIDIYSRLLEIRRLLGRIATEDKEDLW